jgi:uncharacterized protein with von Willebrand factor type A (vWA) domain
VARTSYIPNFELPLRAAREAIDNEPVYERADVVLITDAKRSSLRSSSAIGRVGRSEMDSARTRFTSAHMRRPCSRA